MVVDGSHDYLGILSAAQQATLRDVNRAGLDAFRHYLSRSQATAFLGAGASAPLYPLWGELIRELVTVGAEQGLPPEAARTCLDMATWQPDGVAEILSQDLGPARYRAVLREAFRPRWDQRTGRTWTTTHELVCRCAFNAIVTTNYDTGVVDARSRVRPAAVATGFTSWTDDLSLDQWRTGDILAANELPVLFAHGHHFRPDTMVLATSDYRRAYTGKLSAVLARMVDAWHLVWIGFSFNDQRIGAVLRQVAEQSGVRTDPGAPPRHVAVMAWAPEEDRDPRTLHRIARIQYGADLVLYPAPRGDHSALDLLLATLVDEHVPAVDPLPARVHEPATQPSAFKTTWAHGAERARFFAGRDEELARLDRWAADPGVRLIGVTAWGGAGKTTLVTRWLDEERLPLLRPGVKGIFGWSFYSDPDPEKWFISLLEWARENGFFTAPGDYPANVLNLVRQTPVALVLDGLEVLQEGPASDSYGRLLDGALREVLTAICRADHRSLVVLTSRFPFADVARFDGMTARTMPMPPLTLEQGAALLGEAGAHLLSEEERRELVAEVDGHALAVSAMGSLLAGYTDPGVVVDLRHELARAGRTHDRVRRVLSFYSDRLDPAQRRLIGLVSLFVRPIHADQILTIATRGRHSDALASWDRRRLRQAVDGPLAGLLSWHADGSISAHPLVRETFQPLALGSASVAVKVSLTGTPSGMVESRRQATLVVEAIELCLNADLWREADDLYERRTGSGDVWRDLPAERLGQRAATAFVSTPERRASCQETLGARRLSYYLNAAGLHATNTGDPVTATALIEAATENDRILADWPSLTLSLCNLVDSLGWQGQVDRARATVREATERCQADQRSMVLSYEGWLHDLAGSSPDADDTYLRAARLAFFDRGYHLYSLPGLRWGAFLARTGRSRDARQLTLANLALCQQQGWSTSEARCLVLLARLDIAGGQLVPATALLRDAIECLRDGDVLIELAEALVVRATLARLRGDHTAADADINEVLSITLPRGLVLTSIGAFVARARLAVARHARRNDERELRRGRDAAQAALTHATGGERLPWGEYDAVRAQAALDKAAGTMGRWEAQAEALQRELLPRGLQRRPLQGLESEAKRENRRLRTWL